MPDSSNLRACNLAKNRRSLRALGCAILDGHDSAVLNARQLLQRLEALQWVADTTYLQSAKGFLYPATILRIFSRKVVGLAMDVQQTIDLLLESLKLAIPRPSPEDALLHSHHARGVASRLG